jgi:PAS domain S-box-containing protein
MAVWGLHRLNYPFLRPVEWFAPIGFGIAAALELTVAVGSTLAHAEHVRNKLRASEARYRTLVDNAPQGIFCTSKDRFLNANPALVRMLGYANEAELLNINIVTDLYVEPDARMKIQALHADSDVMDGFETEWARKDGSPLRVALYGRKMRDDAGKVTMYQGVVVDVTDRYQLDQRLRQGERLEALGRLAGGVAHDFNNLLTVMRGAAELTLRTQSEEQRVQCIHDVLDAADRAAQLTGQLLAVSRQKPVVPRSVDLAKHVDATAKLLRRLLGEDIDVRIESTDSECPVYIDPAQLDQILINLAANARDAQPNGGSFTIAVSRLELTSADAEARGTQAGSYVRVCVSDDGPGMDADTRQHAFEPFFTTRGETGGTGLGLATVYAAVLQAGGSVQLQSSEGAGAQFEVLFPLDTREHTTSAPESSETASRTRQTVLVVEDEPTVRQMVARILRAGQHQVLVAADASEALSILEHNAADVLLTDVVMRGKSGSDLADQARRLYPRM